MSGVDDLVSAVTATANGPVERPTPATLTEVAERAGVSRATAARAVGGYGSVSGQARERVLAAVAELRYRPNVVARNTRTGTTTTIGVVVADISNPFFAHAARGISDAARVGGFDIIVVNTDEDLESERAAVQLLLDQRVAGLIVAAASRTDGRHLVEAQSAGVPVVLLDRRVRDLTADRVYSDNLGGAGAAMTRLVMAGHRRIAYVSSAAGPQGAEAAQLDLDDLLTSAGDRIRAYLDRLESVGVDEPRAYLRLCPYGEEAAYRTTGELLALAVPPTAVFASDSVIALGVLRAVHDAGLTIPDDVSVVAGDEAAWARVTTPALSSVVQPVYDLGRTAVQVLLLRLGEPDGDRRDHVLPAGFVDRRSIGDVPAAG
jgi:LacI family transcriptional regulator